MSKIILKYIAIITEDTSKYIYYLKYKFQNINFSKVGLESQEMFIWGLLILHIIPLSSFSFNYWNFFVTDLLRNSSKNIQISYTHVVRECGNSEKCEGGCFVCLFLCVSNIIHTFAQYWQVISHSSFLSLVGGALGIHGIRFLIFCNSLFFFFFFVCSENLS